jgi:uncharacterized protein (TIGR02266 family)
VHPRRTILLADDAALFRDLGSLFLARTGEVTTARDGAEALAHTVRERPAVVVADLHMPRLDGAELCRRIKRDPGLAATPVILVIAGDDPEDRARAVRAGADDVIAKPISRIALIQAVNRLLRGAERRGQTRVPMVAEVQIAGTPELQHGIARNLSRGGIFVEAERAADPETEVALSFDLPDSKQPIRPTAQVIWCRERTARSAAGMGLRFLALDRQSVLRIEDYVYQRAGRGDEETPPLSGEPE